MGQGSRVGRISCYYVPLQQNGDFHPNSLLLQTPSSPFLPSDPCLRILSSFTIEQSVQNIHIKESVAVNEAWKITCSQEELQWNKRSHRPLGCWLYWLFGSTSLHFQLYYLPEGRINMHSWESQSLCKFREIGQLQNSFYIIKLLTEGINLSRHEDEKIIS